MLDGLQFLKIILSDYVSTALENAFQPFVFEACLCRTLARMEALSNSVKMQMK